MERRTARIAAVISAACFGTLAIFANLAYAEGGRPLPLLAWRFAIAAVALGIYLAIRRPGALRVSPSDLGRYVVLGVFGYGAASLCFFHALEYADASVVAVMLYTYPALVVLAERMVSGVSLTRARVAGVVLTFAGCALVLGLLSGGGVEPLGIMLGVGAGVAYCSFSILSHRWLPGRSKLVMMTYTLATNALFIGGFAFATHEPMSPIVWSGGLWLYVALLALVPTVFAVVLYYRAMEQLGPGQAAIISTVEPIFTIFLAGLVLGERLGPVEWLGVLLVIVGVAVAERGARASEVAAVV